MKTNKARLVLLPVMAAAVLSLCLTGCKTSHEHPEKAQAEHPEKAEHPVP